MMPSDVIKLIDAAAEASGLSPHTIGRYASGNGNFYGRLKRGLDLTTRRAARVIQWLSDHWPEDLDWPSDIPRPTPNPDRKEAA